MRRSFVSSMFSCTALWLNSPTMDSKTLNVIEYHKVLERLAAHCDFSASQALARQLEPTTSFELARARQQETTEARKLLALHDLTIGGAHDIRPKVDPGAARRRAGCPRPAGCQVHADRVPRAEEDPRENGAAVPAHRRAGAQPAQPGRHRRFHLAHHLGQGRGARTRPPSNWPACGARCALPTNG